VIDQFKRDGYVVVPCVAPLALSAWSIGAKLRLKHCAEISVDKFRAEARLLAKSRPVFEAFLGESLDFASRQLGIAAPIYQTGITCHAMGYDETFDGTAPHQDWPALQSSLNALVVWIPMQSVGTRNYPLEVVPGSHLLGLLPAKETEHYSEVDATGMEFVHVDVPAGAALFMSVFTVHRTRTPGEGQRLAFSWRIEDAADPFFIEHGYPTAQRRVIERGLKLTPTRDQVRSVFA
jgi:hypothetical protein